MKELFKPAFSEKIITLKALLPGIILISIRNWIKITFRPIYRKYIYKFILLINCSYIIYTTLLIDWSKVWIIVMFWLSFGINHINIWEFVSLMSIVYILDQIFKKSISTYIDFTKIVVNVEKLWDFFDNTPKMKWYKTWKKFEYKKWKIEIENLTYWYSKNKPVFKNFDLKLKWWKITAFVWNSWSWKSTLVKIIAWYIRGDSWNVIIDEQKINKISLKSYYKNIGYLTQEPSVFDWSILDNLMYWAHPQPLPSKEGSRDVWQKHLEKIIKQSKCEFIYDLEDWINTEIWERWVRLSWGQKQRWNHKELVKLKGQYNKMLELQSGF